MTKALSEYCSTHGITIKELGGIVNVTVSQLYLIDGDSHYNVTINTINKIYKKTKEKFGRGLNAYEYLEFSCLDKYRRMEEEENRKSELDNNY